MKSPGSPLSYFSNYMGLTSVEQKIVWGRKLQKMRKSLKSEDRRINKIDKKMCDFENLYFFLQNIHSNIPPNHISIYWQCFLTFLQLFDSSM